jgi:outer membrane protein TolC
MMEARGRRGALLAGLLIVGAVAPALAQTSPGGAIIAPPMSSSAEAAQVIELTLERMVELGLRDSYRVRRLQLDVERTRSLLRAEQASLKSRVSLDINAPEFQAISDYKWNSDLQRNELIAENTRRYQMELSVRQPVILFGYPTNGYLSVNNRVYRYNQIDGLEHDIRYYNRYFVGYNQPLFQPNRMKNDLERAQLDLDSSELDYQEDVVGMIDDLAGDYYELLEDAYRRDLSAELVADLEGAAEAARQVVAANQARSIEVDQLEVALANARQSLSEAESNFRLQTEDIKQRLRLSPADEIAVEASLETTPVSVDVDGAIELARTLAPRMRQLGINLRGSEIRLEETKGRDAFRMNLGLTYGREVQDPRFRNLWQEPRNSYTVEVNATVPIWDWGARGHRIQAEEFNLERSRLSIEEAETEIESNVRSQVRSLEEYRVRLVSMQNTLELARRNTVSTLDGYRAGNVSLVDLLQTIDREASTARNYLSAFMGYQRTLLRLKEMTYYDFEYDMPVVDRFRIEPIGGGTR